MRLLTTATLNAILNTAYLFTLSVTAQFNVDPICTDSMLRELQGCIGQNVCTKSIKDNWISPLSQCVVSTTFQCKVTLLNFEYPMICAWNPEKLNPISNTPIPSPPQEGPGLGSNRHNRVGMAQLRRPVITESHVATAASSTPRNYVPDEPSNTMVNSTTPNHDDMNSNQHVHTVHLTATFGLVVLLWLKF